MILVLDKVSRDMLGVADTIKEAAALRKGREDETVCEIIGAASYIPRNGRK